MGNKTKTGEVNFLDGAGNLWMAESFQDEAGTVETVNTLLEAVDPENPPTEPVPFPEEPPPPPAEG